MNIKTTIVLLVLLLGVGGYVFLTRDKGIPDDTPKKEEHTLLDVKEAKVNSFSIKAADGREIAAQKRMVFNGSETWMLTEPVKAVAEGFKVSSLLSTLTGLKSTEQISAKGDAVASVGLDHPQYKVVLREDGHDTELDVGNRQSIGGGVYVLVKGHDMIDIVPDSILDTLAKPANSLRSDKLFETAPASVQQLTITRRDGTQLVMEKGTTGWLILKPEAMPADGSAVEDLAASVINMQPVSFVDDPSMALGLSKPEATVTFSTAAPSTQPATQPTTKPVPMQGEVKVVFGSYDDVNKKNVFARVPDGTIVTVPASVLEGLSKKPLDLRDKTVINVDPTTVTRLVIASNQPATTQPMAAAVEKIVALQRRPKEVPIMGPPVPKAPTSGATTGPSSRPATLPVVEAPKSEWIIAGVKPADADDAKITALLGQFHPLKADKFLEKPGTAKVVKQYTISLFTSTTAAPTMFTLADLGNDGNLIGSYDGLTFEIPRAIVTDLGAEFGKAAAVK